MPQSSKPMVVGAAPAGAQDRESASRAVRQMFTSIAPRYDLLNHLLSLNIDRTWWWRTARTFRHILERDDARVLDICCGTGDMTFALRRRAGKSRARIFGADFSSAMLVRAQQKSRERSPAPAGWIEADVLQLPLPSAQLDLVTSAFGFRNLADYDAGLREIHRVLRPGGEFGILDFSVPRGVLGKVYRFYFHRVLPRIGRALSGISGAYDTYLPTSVERFPEPDAMLSRMRAVGFAEVSWTPYTFGIAGLYRGKKES
ncbi:MAG: bifunctional demethylmenaquinone methyltransferase/2-methoxy-6-polyprenyl-1,4-benzoquinol methylase UbiE [Candidatus Korobacteraceae bacterium]